MNRRIQGLCAGAIIAFGVAGCTLPESFRTNFFWAQDTHKAGAPCVNGSLEVVAQNTQNILRQLGIAAIASEEGSKFILKCTTKRDDHFAIILEKWSTAQGAQTHVD